MKKWCSAFCLVIFLLMGMGLAYAQPEPIYQVEMNRKPGIDFRRFKSVGNEISVSFHPNSDWAVEKSDPFLKQRIQAISLRVVKNKGWVAVENMDADLRLSVKILEWGRLRNTQDQNLMEYLKFELSGYSATDEGLVFRGTGQYSRVDPTEQNLGKVNEAYRSILEELLASL